MECDGFKRSVIPLFLEKAYKDKILEITHKGMTRFNITLNEGVEMVLFAINNSIGGEILVPKIPSYNILDLAEAIGPNCIKEYIGLRPGEKIHEEMITSSDSLSTIDMGNYFAILPQNISNNKLESEMEELKKKYGFVKEGFSYSSGTNSSFLTVEEIRNLIKDNIKSDFMPQ